jgi:predicted dehydrogenase
MLKIGVLGVGHLGKIHLGLLLQLTDIFEVVGFYDIDPLASSAVERDFKVKSFSSVTELIQAVDCLDIVTPTLNHFVVAAESLRNRKHIFIEKPLSETMEEACILVQLAYEASVVVQIGHVERFNPAFQAALPFLDNPMFIETHRLAQFNPRGTDVPVVLDLMIHDIDVILSIVKSNVKKIAASGVAIVSDSHDITNARIEFENGCVANLTASRISLKNMRKSRFFQKDAYVGVDFLNKTLEVVRMQDLDGEADPFDFIMDLGENKSKKKILIDKPELAATNAILEELKAFAFSINNKVPAKVTIEDGYNAMDVAYRIIEKLKDNSIN